VISESPSKRVFLATAYEPGRAFEAMARAATADRIARHKRVDDPAEADIILFVENVHFDDPWFRRLLAHDLVRRHPDKVLMYNEMDRPWCILPGLYCSMPKRSFQQQRQRAFCYLYTVNPFIDSYSQQESPDILFSFLGAPNHKLRRRIYALNEPDGIVEDTSAFSLWRPLPPAEVEEHSRHYASILGRSKFVLCPRGAGTSSYRLFETMQAGRAPVLISDQWVEPVGPDWSRFLLRVPEADVESLPAVLRRHEHEAAERGAAAREAWLRWFAPDVCFTTAVDAAAAILDASSPADGWRRCLSSLEAARVRLRYELKATIVKGRALATRR
jgi:Exostosin family